MKRRKRIQLPRFEEGTPVKKTAIDPIIPPFSPGQLPDFEVKGNDEATGPSFEEEVWKTRNLIAEQEKQTGKQFLVNPENAARAYGPPDIRKLKYSVRDFYKNDFIKRRQKYHPEETQLGVLNVFDPSDVAYKKMADNLGGYYNPIEQQIRINPNRTEQELRSTLVHEMRHLMDDKHGGLSEEENSILNDAYQLEGSRGYKKRLVKELPAVNTQIRDYISQKNNGILGDDFDTFIKNADDAYVIKMADEASDYFNPEENTPEYLKKMHSGDETRLKKALEKRKKMADAIRRALIEVAQQGGNPYQRMYNPVLLYTPNMNLNYEMA